MLAAVRRHNWMVSVDLKDAISKFWYILQAVGFFVLAGKVVHYSSGHYFGLFTAPQVFTRIMAPVSVELH